MMSILRIDLTDSQEIPFAVAKLRKNMDVVIFENHWTKVSTDTLPAQPSLGLVRRIMGAMIRVLTVDDHPLMRKGVATIIQRQADMELIAEASTGGQAVQLFRKHRPDITGCRLRGRLGDANGGAAPGRAVEGENRVT